MRLDARAQDEDVTSRSDDERWGKQVSREFHGKHIKRTEKSGTRGAQDAQESFDDICKRYHGKAIKK